MEQNLINKLSLQIESLQEGFLTLSKCFSLKEMASSFSQMLKNNFISYEIYLLQKTSSSSGWEIISMDQPDETSALSYLDNTDCLKINYFPDEKIAAVVTLPLSDSSSLGIIIIRKNDENIFSDADKIVLKILLQVFDSAYKSFLDQKKEKKLIFELNEKVFQLNNLVDTAIELSRFEKRNILYNLALERVSTITNAASAMMKIYSTAEGTEEIFCFPENLNPDEITSSKYKIESSFVYKARTYTFILSEKETRGGVTYFNDLDQVLLDAITRQVSASIENEELHKHALEKEIMEKEIAVAASIQKQIIPDTLPSVEGYEIAGLNIPSKEVGGDYFDCIDLKNGKFAFVIADVAGKGISAALLVNTLNAALYSYLEFNLPLNELSFKLNKIIYKSSPSDKYITFFIAILDPTTGELDVMNAGHNPILLLRNDGTLEKIEAGGIGLGMLDFGLPYTGAATKMAKGDILFLYTDGIPEAMNFTEEEYSDQRMVDFLKNNSNKPAQQFLSSLVNDVKLHTEGAPQSDDITSLILRRI